MALNEYFKKFKRGCELMNDRDKLEPSMLCNGEAVHIDGVDFLTGDDGDYAVFTVHEYSDGFFYGNSIVTEVLKQIKEDDKLDLLAETKVVFTEKTSKKGRKYISIDFVE